MYYIIHIIVYCPCINIELPVFNGANRPS